MESEMFVSRSEKREREDGIRYTLLKKLYFYFLNGSKIKLRLKTHPEYFFEGIIHSVDIEDCIADNQVYMTLNELKEYPKKWNEEGERRHKELQEKKREWEEADKKFKKRRGRQFVMGTFEDEIISEETSEHIGERVPELYLKSTMEELFMDCVTMIVLETQGIKTILSTQEIDPFSIHPAEINPIAYFTRGNISEETRRLIRERCKGLCELKLKGCTGNMEEVDHWIPSSRGGSEDISNLRGACSHCNKKKSDRLWEEIPAEEKI